VPRGGAEPAQTCQATLHRSAFFLARLGTAKILLLASKKLIASERDMSSTGQRGVEQNIETALESPMTELYEKSRAAEFGLSSGQFMTILEEVAAKHLPALSTTQRQELYTSLRV